MSDIIRLHNRIFKPRWEWRPKLNPNHPLSIGLVGLWLFNETGGLKAYDLSGKNNHGTLTNGPTWKPGRFGQSLFFDGVDDYVDPGNGISLNVSSGQGFTITAWVKTSDSYGLIVALRNSTDVGNVVFDLPIGYNGDTTLAGNFLPLMRYDDKTGLAQITSSQNIADNKWHFVATVLDQNGNTFKAYVDTNVYSTGQTVDGSITTQERAIGSEREWVRTGYGTADQQYFNGLIDGVRIYNRALSAKAIRWLYQEPFAGIDVPIFKDYWPEVVAWGLSIPVAMQNMRGGFKPIGMRGGFVN